MNNNPLGQFAASSFTPLYNTRRAGRAYRNMPGGGGDGGGGGGGYGEEFDNQSTLAGMGVARNPFLMGLGNSMQTMEGLGGTVGGAFAGVNAQNLASQRLNTLGSLLNGMFNRGTGGGGNAGPGYPGGGSFRDTQSRMSVSY